MTMAPATPRPISVEKDDFGQTYVVAYSDGSTRTMNANEYQNNYGPFTSSGWYGSASNGYYPQNPYSYHPPSPQTDKERAGAFQKAMTALKQQKAWRQKAAYEKLEADVIDADPETREDPQPQIHEPDSRYGESKAVEDLIDKMIGDL